MLDVVETIAELPGHDEQGNCQRTKNNPGLLVCRAARPGTR